MSRKPTVKRLLFPDPVYNRVSVHMLVNRLLKNGKKAVSYRIVYNVLRKLSELNNSQNPVEIWETALLNVQPRVEVKPRRRGGAIQQVPYVIRSVDRAQALAIRWVLGACQKRSGKDMVSKLVSEISDASKKTGLAFRKKEELHKLALSNQMNSRRPETIVQAIMGQEENSSNTNTGNTTTNTKTSTRNTGKSKI